MGKSFLDIVGKEEESWNIVDATKLKAYMECPRSFFYEYILGWRGEDPSIHLEFGKAWHYAMEHLLLHGYSTESVKEAWTLLNNHYRKHFMPEQDMQFAPKNPGNALSALVGYVKEYQNIDKEDKVLYTEIAGVASISQDRVMHFRMDSIIENNRGIFSREHKTAGTLSRQWRDQWSMSIQVGMYLHVLYSLYPYDDVWGVQINGTIFNKTKTQYERVPCRRTKDMMECWLSTVNYWYEQMEYEKKLLWDASTDDKIMTCFPKNPNACTNYFGCKYHDFCMAWANPLQHIEEVPQGMKVEHWNPMEEESKIVFNV